MKPVRRSASSPEALQALGQVGRATHHALVVDLNNFATFPTMAVGILVAAMRNAGHRVTVVSPLANDAPAVERERPDTFLDHLSRRAHLSTWGPFQGVRDFAREMRNDVAALPHPRAIAAVRAALATNPDVVLLSAYLQHRRLVTEIARLASKAGVKVILGGPMFNLPTVAEEWRTIPGVSAVVGGEVDLSLPAIVEALLRGEDLLSFEGVTLPDGRQARGAAPLRALNAVPVPDYTDFPWDRYRTRIIPLMTGRGCQWNRCNFCSDVISASGRTFRTRSVDSVMLEIREQARRHQVTNFLFLDLKLNSSPAMFRGIIENIQRNARGAQWIGTVHVDQRRDNGLSRADLRAAASSGMRRISFGLESGSQRLLDAMEKGCTVEANATFIREAYDAGISVRATMFKGYPGETAEDLQLTADFLEANAPYLDRIRFNDFSIPLGTPIAVAIATEPKAFPSVHAGGVDMRQARTRYSSRGIRGRAYQQAFTRVLRAVYSINRRPIRSSAQAFDGLM